MIKQKSKAELLKDIQVERRRLENTIAALPKEDMTRSGVVGEWSVKDILAHLAAWEQLFLSWYESGLHGRIPDESPVGMSIRKMDALNQQIYNQYRLSPLEDVLAEFQHSFQQVLATVMEIPEDEMFALGRYAWTGKLALADYIAGNTCNHYYWSKTKIRSWLKAQQKL